MTIQAINGLSLLKPKVGAARTRPIAILTSSLTLTLALAAGASQAQAPTNNAKHHLQIDKTEQVGAALSAFAAQTDNEILFTSDVAKGKTTDGLVGEFTDLEALGKILEGTGLKFEKDGDKVFVVRDTSAKENERSSNEEIIAVGSHIRGVRDSASPLLLFDRENVVWAGYTTTVEFLRTLTQNNALELTSEDEIHVTLKVDYSVIVFLALIGGCLFRRTRKSVKRQRNTVRVEITININSE